MKQLLIWLGILSKCCGEKTVYDYGWDRTYCSKCEKRC